MGTIGALLRGLLRDIADSYRLGFRTLLVAPAIVALAAIPEFVQHAVEIRIGMFDSRESAMALAPSGIRWSFGYAKIAGFVLAILLTARLWAMQGSFARTWRMPVPLIAKTVGIFGAMILSGAALTQLGLLLPAAATPLAILSGVLQAAILVWLIGTLAGDPAISLRSALTDRLPTAALMLVLFAIAFLPGQMLHALDHRLALGQPRALVWALMLFDSLVVGLMAAVAGAALWLGWRTGATWRGWARPPDPS